jgi:hypothetical protein
MARSLARSPEPGSITDVVASIEHVREIEQETIDAVRLNAGPPQPISLMRQDILDH